MHIYFWEFEELVITYGSLLKSIKTVFDLLARLV